MPTIQYHSSSRGVVAVVAPLPSNRINRSIGMKKELLNRLSGLRKIR